MGKYNFDETNFSQTLSVPVAMESAEIKEIVDYLYSNGNRLLTATGARLQLSHDVQSLVAYFSSGEIIISRTHKYDGRVLAFLDLLRERNMVMKKPFYSDLGLVSAIYKTYEGHLGGMARNHADFDNQMQKDFVEFQSKVEKEIEQKINGIR